MHDDGRVRDDRVKRAMIAAVSPSRKSNLRVTSQMRVAPPFEVGGEEAKRKPVATRMWRTSPSPPPFQRDPRLLSPSSPPLSSPRHVRKVPARQLSARHDECVQRRRPEVRPGPHPVRDPGLSGRYIRDFTKALSGEVRALLDVVGALRDERLRL
jgi:hypothetical protein